MIFWIAGSMIAGVRLISANIFAGGGATWGRVLDKWGRELGKPKARLDVVDGWKYPGRDCTVGSNLKHSIAIMFTMLYQKC